ncbi:hypothetical protein B484DRAFT_465685 [Ochromonadaceae sp. CCMP2298]|nr:hypothetical protein B484DRAFT_465685 [Ochromonadaceae sp. CCMP2298]
MRANAQKNTVEIVLGDMSRRHWNGDIVTIISNMTNSPSTTALCQRLLGAVLKTPQSSTSAMTSVTLYEPLVPAIGILTVVNDTENCIEMADPVTSEYEDEGDFSDAGDFIPNRMEIVRAGFYQDFHDSERDFIDHDPIEVSYPPDIRDDISVYSTPITRNGHKKPAVIKTKKTVKHKPKVIKKIYVPVLRREILTMVEVVDARKDSSSGPDMVHGNCIGKSDDRVRAMYDDIIALEQDVVLSVSTTNASASRVPTIDERTDIMTQLERVRRETTG